jgi:hypothetical protein
MSAPNLESPGSLESPKSPKNKTTDIVIREEPQEELDIIEIEPKVEKDNEPEIEPREKFHLNQDSKQMIKSTMGLLIEFYRVLMGSFLVVFVPQKCGEEVCSFNENVYSGESHKYASLYLNLVCFASFVLLYGVEYYREYLMIQYLEVNHFKSNDNTSVEKALQPLAIYKKNRLWRQDKYYKRLAYLSMGLFVVNVGSSINSIYHHYLDSKTLTVLLTNFIFIATKLVDVITTVYTPKNIFYSAYMKKKIQFNDVDQDHLD